MVVRLERTAGRWASTALVVSARQLDSRIMKDAARSVTNVVDALNANPGYSFGELGDVGHLLDEALAEVVKAENYAPPPRTDREPLTRPDGTDPDGYARKVAEAYADAVSQRRSPAEALAEETGAPIATARGWIREARRRGALPPGRRKAAN